MERSLRISRITALLNRPQGATMAALTQELDVSRATINRDLELMRSQMNTPIVWDRFNNSYHIDSSGAVGPRHMLPGIWLSPEQAYAFLTLNNMVEQLAPSLLGPFLDPMRGMLKEILVHSDIELYKLNRKVEITGSRLPAISDQMFHSIIQALLHEEHVELVYTAEKNGVPLYLPCVIKRLRILPKGWRLVLQFNTNDKIEIDVTRVIAINERNESKSSDFY